MQKRRLHPLLNWEVQYVCLGLLEMMAKSIVVVDRVEMFKVSWRSTSHIQLFNYSSIFLPCTPSIQFLNLSQLPCCTAMSPPSGDNHRPSVETKVSKKKKKSCYPVPVLSFSFSLWAARYFCASGCQWLFTISDAIKRIWLTDWLTDCKLVRFSLLASTQIWNIFFFSLVFLTFLWGWNKIT